MEMFAASDRFIVKQKKEMVEILLNWESNNRYEIYDSQGQVVCYALEDTSCCDRYWCKQARAFHIKFVAGQDSFVEMQANCDCFGQEIEIESPKGSPMGHISKPFACCRPTFYLKDRNADTLFEIPSPWGAACCKCCSDVEIPVLSAKDGSTVATITKQWAGVLKETFTDAETFGVEFKTGNLTPFEKTLILCAVFPIDFQFFEQSTQNNN